MPESNSEFPARSRLMYLGKGHELNDKQKQKHVPTTIRVKLFFVSFDFMLLIVLNTIINDKKHHYNISLEKHCNTTYCTLMIPITTTMLIIFTEYYSSYFERKVCLRWFEVPPLPSSLISGCGDPDSCKREGVKKTFI